MKHDATGSPVTQVNKRTVEADLAPVIDTVRGSSTPANPNKADTLVNVSSRIIEANEKGDLLLRTFEEETKSFVNDEPTDIWKKKIHTIRKQHGAVVPQALLRVERDL